MHTPKYRHHKHSDRGFVEVRGKRRYFAGPYGSAKSLAEYHDLCARLIAEKRGEPPPPERNPWTVAMLIDKFCVDELPRFQKGGKPTSEQSCYLLAVRPLVRLYGDLPAKEFSPAKLIKVRQAMIDAGYVRESINRHVGRIRRIWKWAVAQEIIAAETWHALQAVAGLRRGSVPDRPPVRPVSLAHIFAVEPHVTPPVWAMIQFQLLTGARPGEVCRLRPCDLDRSGDVWRYVPASHKTEHHGHERVILIGPKARAVLEPWLDNARPDLPVWRPADGRALHLETIRKRDPRRRSPGRRRKPAGNEYTPTSYGQAIRRGCERAFGMPEELRVLRQRGAKKLTAEEWTSIKARAEAWRKLHCWHPHQLRHTAATAIRAEFGAEAARVVLGHASLKATEVYAERDLALAEDIARRLG